MAARAYTIVVAAALAACGGDAGGPSGLVPGPLASVTVSPPSVTIGVGDAVRFQALELDSTGHFVLQFPINWGVTDLTVAQISDSGVAVGLAPGTDTVLAVVETKVGRAILRVQ